MKKLILEYRFNKKNMQHKIKQLTLHKVGNKLKNDQVSFSKGLLNVDSRQKLVLSEFFFSTFKKNTFYNLYHESDLELNEIFTYTSRIFDDEFIFYEESKNIAKHLYSKSEHPKIKKGDLYVTYLTDCVVEDKVTDAIGIFKSESKDTIIKVLGHSGEYKLEIDSGANIDSLDKGCIIYNTDKYKGYLVSIIDNLGRNGTEAQYWKDDFLYVRSRKDEYFHTENVMGLCRSFVNDILSERDGVSKVEKIALINKTADFFVHNESFDLDEFSKEVYGTSDIIGAFNDYKNIYELEKGMVIETQFNISEQALKKQIKTFKNIIKLDDNFRIMVDTSNNFIEKGFDDKLGLNYYKLYYKDEK